MENAITGTGFSVYTASGIRSYKLSLKRVEDKDVTALVMAQVKQCTGSRYFTPVTALSITPSPCTPLPHLHSAPVEKTNAAAKRRGTIPTPTETLLLSVSVSPYPDCL